MTEEEMTIPNPVEIKLGKDKDLLKVSFDDGKVFEFSAEFLRVYSPSAEVKGHGSEPRKIIGGKKAVKIATIEAVGNYAIKPVFDDGHDTGIFTWRYLYETGLDIDKLWEEYLSDLNEKKLQR